MKTFVLLNLAAGFLHYLFQVVAAQRLPAESFSTLSAWLAYLSFAFVGSSVLQYLSCFLPLTRRKLRVLLLGGSVTGAAIGALPFVFDLDRPMLGLLAGMMACIFSIYSGQTQVRLSFTALALANVAVGLVKLLLVLSPLLPAVNLQLYVWAVVFSYIPALALLTAVLVLHSRFEFSANASRPLRAALISTFILGAASALFPQFELMLMRQTQTPEVFNGFARLSLFYKGIFFSFLIFAQWLLPHQLRDQSSTGNGLTDLRLAGLTVALGLAAAITGPFLAQKILGWAEVPSRMQIFLSCLNMALLTWLFLLLQGICARQKLMQGALLLAGVFVLAPVQLLAGLSIEMFYAVAVIWNSLVVWRAITYAGAGNPKSPSPLNAA